MNNDSAGASNESEYILGTDIDELHRLGLQHRVWSEAALHLWESAGFGKNQTILDLGCGPGYTTLDLAYIVGSQGKIVAIDKSPRFIDFLNANRQRYAIDHIDLHICDLLDLDIPPESLDGVYSRWVMSWLDNADAVVGRLVHCLKPGAVIAVQEYFNWGSFCVQPQSPALARVVEAALQSWQNAGCTIDIGADLPAIFQNHGLTVEHIRPLARIGRPGSMPWHWLSSFLHNYVPKLVGMGLLTENDRLDLQREWSAREADNAAFCFAPQMIEIMARKH